ncbi:unnamed protein product [Symbiodinium natans]|uniref:Uncharacterized protein n=1 Tax=Symbiodinium natans TaxID=878477 RepID=A0A812LV19_9DINO|nr:unnamed protein product [Symbiodinium natans]
MTTRMSVPSECGPAAPVEARPRACFKLDVLLHHLQGGGKRWKRTEGPELLDAMLPWPLRDALGKECVVARDPNVYEENLRTTAGVKPTLTVPRRQRWRAVTNQQTAIDAERWWPAL